MFDETISQIFHGKRILVIDDSETFRELIKNILTEVGCIVDTFDNPLDIETYLFNSIPDCIITDDEMPDMTGPEVCAVVKEDERYRNIPIVLITSKEDKEHYIEGIRQGADDYILKKSLPEMLLVKILSMLRLKQLKDQLVQKKQFEAIKSMIGTYNHELNNALLILNTDIKILTKKAPEELGKFLSSLQVASDRIHAVVQKISQIDQYAESDYASDDKIVDIYNL